MNHQRWFAPEYYLDFSCKANKCRHTCCGGWRIPVSKNEYNRLITMECSEELNKCIQNAFILPETTDDNCYRYISFNWLGQCRILHDGLCMLHKEKGEEYLPKICRLYPRSLKNINGVNVASCSSSCEKIIEMLYEKECLGISEISLDNKAEINYQVSTQDVEQIGLFQQIIKDRTTTLVQSLESICMIINEKEFVKDYHSDSDPLDISLNLLNKISVSNPILEQIAADISERYKDRSVFEKDRIVFENKYPDWMNFFERVINNSMIYECFPFVDTRADKTKVYKGLCCCYGLLRLVSIGATYSSDNKDNLVDAISALFHVIDHTPFYYNVSILSDNAALMLKI